MGKHGLSKTRLYKKWIDMKRRCNSPRHISYKWYGGKGIRVCAKWNNDFLSFKEYVTSLPDAMKMGYSIDRIDSNLGYEPGNIRWANSHVQSVNRGICRNNTSGYIGVSRHRDKWASYISIHGKMFYIGVYDSAIEAATARNDYIVNNSLSEYALCDFRDS